MIVSKVRNPCFVTMRRGGTLTDSDGHLLYGLTMSNASRVGVVAVSDPARVRGAGMGVGGLAVRVRGAGATVVCGRACSSSTARGRVVAELGPSGGWGPVDLLEVAGSSSVKHIRMGSRTVSARVCKAVGGPEGRAGQLHDRVVQ